MALDIKSEQGVVQLVLTVDMVEAFLSRFPAFTLFEIPTNDDDIPTYGVTLKNMPSQLSDPPKNDQ
jgi:hypothetical protein